MKIYQGRTEGLFPFLGRRGRGGENQKFSTEFSNAQLITKYIEKATIPGACHRPPQNGFRERKVYHNFVLILYNFVH